MIVRHHTLTEGGLVLQCASIMRTFRGTLELLVSVVGRGEARVRLALDLGEELGVIPLEKGVSKLDLCYASPALVEIVHIELPDERIQVAVLEVLSQGLMSEAFPILNFEGESIRCPLDNARQVLRVDHFKQLAEEDGHLGLRAIILFRRWIKILHFIKVLL